MPRPGIFIKDLRPDWTGANINITGWEVGLLSFTIYASAPAILLLSPVLRTPAFPTKIDALGIDLAGAGGGCRPLSPRAGAGELSLQPKSSSISPGSE